MKPKNVARRRPCQKNFLAFCKTYFPELSDAKWPLDIMASARQALRPVLGARTAPMSKCTATVKPEAASEVTFEADSLPAVLARVEVWKLHHAAEAGNDPTVELTRDGQPVKDTLEIMAAIFSLNVPTLQRAGADKAEALWILGLGPLPYACK